jgi:fatty-acid peroxygenase
MSLSLCNTDPNVFTNPHQFDPARFSPERAEQDSHPHAFVPQGGGPPEGHRCLGLEYSSVVAQVLVARLLATTEFTLPEQDLSLSYSTIPPEHADGLRMMVTMS